MAISLLICLFSCGFLDSTNLRELGSQPILIRLLYDLYFLFFKKRETYEDFYWYKSLGIFPVLRFGGNFRAPNQQRFGFYDSSFSFRLRWYLRWHFCNTLTCCERGSENWGANGGWRMEKCGWKNEDDEMRMKHYVWQYADDKILLIGNEFNVFSCSFTCR